MTAKLSRVLNRIQVRTYDLSDAVEYLILHQLVSGDDGRPVKRSQIQRWAEKYNHQVNDEILSRLRTAYQGRYGQTGLE